MPAHAKSLPVNPSAVVRSASGSATTYAAGGCRGLKQQAFTVDAAEAESIFENGPASLINSVRRRFGN